MKRINLKKIIDEKYKPSQSIILRYHKSGISALNEEDLKKISLKEGEKIFHLIDYKGVPIYILDETTSTETNTFEALVAAITLAYCKKKGYKKIIFSSGGNLGTALAAYAQEAGIEAYSFNPLVNMPILDKEIFSKKGICLVGVQETQKTRDMVLKFRKKIMPYLDYDPLIPTLSWRFEAFGFRGIFISEFMKTTGINFSIIAQTISAGFGPLGSFSIITELFKKKNLKQLPRFLGVQQESNCYMFQRWANQKIFNTSSLIVPTLFDKNPNKTFGTYEAIASLLEKTKGSLVTVNHQEFHDYISKQILNCLAKNGLKHTVEDEYILAKSGLMALAGVLKAVDHCIIREGPALICMTDGAKKPSKPAEPSFIIKNDKDLNHLVKEFRKEL